jgi:hypothetical protein
MVARDVSVCNSSACRCAFHTAFACLSCLVANCPAAGLLSLRVLIRRLVDARRFAGGDQFIFLAGLLSWGEGMSYSEGSLARGEDFLSACCSPFGFDLESLVPKKEFWRRCPPCVCAL